MVLSNRKNRRPALATRTPPLAPPLPWCVPALATRFPRAFRRVLRALSSCALSRSCAAPLTPLLSRRPPPLQRVLPQLPCVLLLLPRLSAFSVLPRAFAMCCCAAHSHAPPCRARPPCCSPTGPVQDSRDAALLCLLCYRAVCASLRCYCRAVALAVPLPLFEH